MKDHVNIGPVPCNEDCIQVGEENYQARSRTESLRFLKLIQEVCGPEPENAKLVIKSFPHDFGSYIEVCVEFNDEDEQAIDYAYHCEAHAPANWDGSGGVKWESRTE
jgi:hypothetical protein